MGCFFEREMNSWLHGNSIAIYLKHNEGNMSL